MNLDNQTPKEFLTNLVNDLFMDFLYYDRKSCEYINIEEMRSKMDDGTFSKEMMLEVFTNQINKEYE